MEFYNKNQAILKDLKHITLYLFNYFRKEDLLKVRLYEDNKFVCFLKLDSFSISEDKVRCVVSLSFNYKIKPGKDYRVFDSLNRAYSLDVSYLASLDEFEKKYRYDGVLGSIYSKEKTEFRVFSPLATKVFCYIFKNGEEHTITLKREECGVFIGSIDGDFEGYKYLYIAKISGKMIQVCDPYASSVDTNSQFAYIVDIEKIKSINSYQECINKVSKMKSLIYEFDVRDMTSKLNIDDSGTFKAMSNPNLKYKRMNAGLSYIKDLGVTHVQIMPVYDFQTIADDFKCDSYNWGYDPKFYFAIEGSYASNSEDPYARMIEFKNMISSFHKCGIKVNLDVVFNHVFDSETNPLNRLLPNYCYRKNEDGSLANSTGCGNELETRKYMIRKLIIDNVKYFKEVYGIDGFRFDLMGLIDIKTIQEVRKCVDSFSKDDLVYGEGWDMQSPLSSEHRSCLANTFKLENVGFFNDRFRDVLRGRNQFENLSICGYLNGDTNYIDGFKHVYQGSILPISFPPLFKKASQSINYVECHDDNCLFDKLITCNSNLEITLDRINLINTVILFSNGISFIHMGQEFGQSKHMVRNSYNAGDDINGFDYQLMYSRKDMVEYFKQANYIKKTYIDDFKIDSPLKVASMISFEELPKKGLLIRYSKNNKEKMLILINPNLTDIEYPLKGNYKLVFSKNGVEDKLVSSNIVVDNISVMVLIRG